MDRDQFVNGNEIVDYWGYLNSVIQLIIHLPFFLVNYLVLSIGWMQL